MADNSKIEWTDMTANPIRLKNSKGFYCIRVSEGCKNCYAATMSRRLQAMSHDAQSYDYKKYLHEPELELDYKMLAKWPNMKRGRRIFVSSMTDVFGEFVPTNWIHRILDAMIESPQHTFQVLTKRAARMSSLVSAYCFGRNIKALPPHIWLGVSVEDQKNANERIPHLLDTPCSVRFLSCEPLLGPVDLINLNPDGLGYIDCLSGRFDKPKVNWLICGGESGPKARPVHPAWIRSLQKQCEFAGTAFFFKQWGEYYTKWVNMTNMEPAFKEFETMQQWINKATTWVNKGDKLVSIDGRPCNIGKDFQECAYPVAIMNKVGKRLAGNTLDGKQYQEFPKIE